MPTTGTTKKTVSTTTGTTAAAAARTTYRLPRPPGRGGPERAEPFTVR
jgi:hypothetical protein